jgi:hypothetical protein
MLLVYTNHVLFCWLLRLELGYIIYQEFLGLLSVGNLVKEWGFGKDGKAGSGPIRSRT